MIPTLKVKRLSPLAKLPMRMTDGAAGLDICPCESKMIPPHRMTKMKTGLAFEIPSGYFIEIHIRSSWGKMGIRLANCTGILDEDFRGETVLYLYNDSDEPFYISDGTRIAQINLMKRPTFYMKETDELTATDRGFESGSTGNN